MLQKQTTTPELFQILMTAQAKKECQMWVKASIKGKAAPGGVPADRCQNFLPQEGEGGHASAGTPP